MKKILDFTELVREASFTYKRKQGQTKNQKENHILLDNFSTYFNSLNENLNFKKIPYSKISHMEKREVYTIKKKVLEKISENLFNKKEINFFESFIIFKISPEDSHFFAKSLGKNQIAYIFFDSQILSVLKFSKNSQVLDPIDGSVFRLNSLFQNLEKKYFPLEIEGIPYQAEIPLSYGIVILDKIIH